MKFEAPFNETPSGSLRGLNLVKWTLNLHVTYKLSSPLDSRVPLPCAVGHASLPRVVPMSTDGLEFGEVHLHGGALLEEAAIRGLHGLGVLAEAQVAERLVREGQDPVLGSAQAGAWDDGAWC